MTKEEETEDFKKRVQEVTEFAKERQVAIGATQQITEENYLVTVPLFRNLKPTE